MSNLARLPPILAAQSWGEPTSAEALEVTAGDLWVMSWDGIYCGLVCIAAVKQGFVLGWPVTLPEEPSFAPALVMHHTPLGSAVLLWPTRETGLGMHLLHRPLGRLIEPQRIQQIAWALEDGKSPGLPFASGSASAEPNASADVAMVARWQELCFHTWPEVSLPYLSEARIKIAGGTAKRTAECLALNPVELRPLWIGVQPVSAAQLSALADDLGVDEAALLGDDPWREAVERLALPVFKAPLLDLASKAGITEGDARNRTRSQYALAARDDSLTISDTRLLDAIKRAEITHD